MQHKSDKFNVPFTFMRLEWSYTACHWDRHVIIGTASVAICLYLYLAESVVSVFLMSLIKQLIIVERFTSSADTRQSPDALSMLGQSR